MAGFVIRKGEDENDIIVGEISNTTVAIGDLLMLPAGSRTWRREYNPATIQAWHLKGVAAQAIASAADGSINIRLVNPTQLWEASTANNSNIAHKGQRMILTDENTVNNTGSDSTSDTAIVLQTDVIGAAADKRTLVRFADSTGFDPDATA